MPITNMPLGVVAVMLPELDLPEQLALLRQLGVTHYVLRPRIIPENRRGTPWQSHGNHKFDLTPERLLKEAKQLRRQFDDAGVVPFGTMPNVSTAHADDELKLHLEGAAAIGAGRLRIGPAGPGPGLFDYGETLRKLIDRYHAVVGLARGFGLKVDIETHMNSMAAGPVLAWNIVHHFPPAELGVMFDLPNYAREGLHPPHVAVSLLAQWVDMVHVGGCRKITKGYDALGFRTVQDQMCPLTESDLHLPSYLAALRDAGVAAPLCIEDYTENMPGGVKLAENVRALRRAMESA